MTLDHSLEEHAARRALQKALSNKSVWIYHIYSQSLPGLSIIAGFLTTERSRTYSHSHTGKGKGSVAITAVFTEEVYRSRGVAESLVRAATRYHLVDLQYDYVSIYVDPRNETTCRVFSRVGFGIMDREVKEEIPVKLIKIALHQQWEEEKAQVEAEEAANDALLLAQTENDEDGSNSIPIIRTSAVIREQEEKEQQALKQKDGNGTGASAIPSAGAGGLLPTDEENEAALEAENGKPLCSSAEEWQVVSLKARDQSHTMMTADARSRMRGHAKWDDPRRLSTEVPWH
jgi:ribosomal protein S18 acetylase RimI-like enzyme